MDMGQYTALIFIDLKKAFDTVHHEILLKKIKKYGVNGLKNALFKSYLTKRLQFCKVNGVSSTIDEINCGVPQGSCLGPQLFLIHINDLPFCLQNSDVTMHADDTISSMSKNIGDLNSKLNNDLACLKGWLHVNILTLNITKIQALVVGSRPILKEISNNVSEAPCFIIGETNIEIVQKKNIFE